MTMKITIDGQYLGKVLKPNTETAKMWLGESPEFSLKRVINSNIFCGKTSEGAMVMLDFEKKKLWINGEVKAWN